MSACVCVCLCVWQLHALSAQSAGADEYNDFLSAECSGYDIKQSDGEASALENWGM